MIRHSKNFPAGKHQGQTIIVNLFRESRNCFAQKQQQRQQSYLYKYNLKLLLCLYCLAQKQQQRQQSYLS
jgi:hypothetical protein